MDEVGDLWGNKAYGTIQASGLRLRNSMLFPLNQYGKGDSISLRCVSHFKIN